MRRLAYLHSYYPCLFVLKPGQLLHINKGRLHAFRKMSRSLLEANDCHSTIRAQVIKDRNITKDVVCMSVAWDWMYRGKTCEGIKEEVVQTLDSVKLARDHNTQSLAIPQLSIIETAKFHLAKYKFAMRKNGEFMGRPPLLLTTRVRLSSFNIASNLFTNR